MTAPIHIGGRTVGPGCPTFVVAELSANHQQRLERAVELVRAAARCGADAVKLQTYTPDTLTLRSNRAEFVISGGTVWDGRTLHDLYREAYLPWDWHPAIREAALEAGLVFFSTAFDPTAVDFLETLGTAAHKVASFELVDLPLVRKMAATGKPLIVSVGMATLPEIEEAVTAAREAGATEIVLLKCTSAYPTPPAESHLRTIPHLAETFCVPVGLSDHTLGTALAPAAVALGACLIEKHLTLCRADGGPDSAFSSEPDEFKAMVQAVRDVDVALGEVHYGPTASEVGARDYRRSLYIVMGAKAGEILSERHVRSIRPGRGLHPRHLAEVLGRRLTRAVEPGTPLSWDLIE